MAVAALQRVVRLHPLPLAFRQVLAQGQKLLTGVDRPENMAPDLLRGLHLPGDLVRPVVRHVAIRAGRPHARAVREMDRALELLEGVGLHLVAAGAEPLGVGGLEDRVEAAPEEDAGQEAAEGQESKAQGPCRRERLTNPFTKPGLAQNPGDDGRHVTAPAARSPPRRPCR